MKRSSEPSPVPARHDGTEPMIADGAVYLRAAERSDIPNLVVSFNDYRTGRMGGARTPISLASEERWFDTMLAEQGKTVYFFVACLVEDDRPIGTINLFDLDWINGSAMLGIIIGNPADHGRGFGTSMLRAILRFGFESLRLERVALNVYDFNTYARRVYERVGFVSEGVSRRGSFREGRFVDDYRMAIKHSVARGRSELTRHASPKPATLRHEVRSNRCPVKRADRSCRRTGLGSSSDSSAPGRR